MKKVIFFLLFLVSQLVFSQNQNCIVKGVIVDYLGDPVPYSTIYIPDLNYGVMSNSNGEFELACGPLELKVQCLGYNSKLVKIDSVNSFYTIQLDSRSYMLPEVMVGANNEDPAYNMIRKAIVMNQYYKQQVLKYDAEIYTRNYIQGELSKAAKLLSGSKKEDTDKMKAGFIEESVKSYQYNRDQENIEQVKKYKNTDNDSLSGIELPIYHPDYFEFLYRTKIFDYSFKKHYKCELINNFLEDNNLIYKIKLTPRTKEKGFASGFIYLRDNSWSIYSLDINFSYSFAQNIHLKQFFLAVEPYCHLAITAELDVDMRIPGVLKSGKFKHLHNFTYFDVDIDLDVKKKIENTINSAVQKRIQKVDNSDQESDKKIKSEKTKTEIKRDKILAKEVLTTVDLIKIKRLNKKIEKNEQKKKGVKKYYEVTKYQTQRTIAEDALVIEDSVWKQHAQIPYSKEEIAQLDKINKFNKTIKKDTLNKTDRFRKRLLSDYKFDRNNLRINIFSPIKIGLTYNTVDGYLLSKKILTANYTLNKNRYFRFSPRLQYSFSRREIMYDIKTSFLYNPQYRGKVSLNFGKRNSDFNSVNPMGNQEHYISCLYFTENHKKLFGNNFFKINNRVDILNGLELNITIDYQKRYKMINHSEYKSRFINTDYQFSSNIPTTVVNHSDDLFDDHKSFSLKVDLEYVPARYYRYVKGVKRYMSSNNPKFHLSFSKGIKNIFNSDVDYSLLHINVSQSTRLYPFDKVYYYIGYDKFIDNSKVYFADFISVNTIPFYLNFSNDPYAFRLLEYYNYNNTEYMFSSHIFLRNDFIFKRLPLIRNTQIFEEIRFSYLNSIYLENYFEFGYSINNIYAGFSLEINGGFDHDDSMYYGVKISNRILGLF